MKGVIKVFPVNCGDAIRIIQKNGSGKTIGNILIDSGYIGTYKVLKEGIGDIIEKKSKIDLWVLTHLDADHINGAVKFLTDSEIQNGEIVIKKLWFNFSDSFRVHNSNGYVSFGKGIKLKKDMQKLNIPFNNEIIAGPKKYIINNAKLTILSPDPKTYKELMKLWEIEEKKYDLIHNSSFAGRKDYDWMKIKELSNAKDVKLSATLDLANRSSIAFIYEVYRTKVLFLGDAMPQIIIESLKSLGYSKKKRLKIKYLKLAHHGSRANYNRELLDYIDCNEFIISADGNNVHGIPDKEVLAKIILHPKRNFKKKMKFYFNYADDRFLEMFKVDEAERMKYNFETIFPRKGKVLKLKF
ncbi:MAG: hypothetical protein BGO31_13095 [Bacteroidetes bacterium 43-16]|nr:MAG: hypothetical protein BGO31_13095 [Bacteroidetes bacterium 43-16]